MKAVSIDFDQPDRAERVSAELAENAQIQMLMAETFWATRFGMVMGPFRNSLDSE